jgi:hypothetical protein
MTDISTQARFTRAYDLRGGHYIVSDANDKEKVFVQVKFQEGTAPGGVNGCWVEDLIDIAVSRLKGYQEGRLPHPTNDLAILHLLAARGALAQRTAGRVERGVEGSMEE